MNPNISRIIIHVIPNTPCRVPDAIDPQGVQADSLEIDFGQVDVPEGFGDVVDGFGNDFVAAIEESEGDAEGSDSTEDDLSRVILFLERVEETVIQAGSALEYGCWSSVHSLLDGEERFLRVEMRALGSVQSVVEVANAQEVVAMFTGRAGQVEGGLVLRRLLLYRDRLSFSTKEIGIAVLVLIREQWFSCVAARVSVMPSQAALKDEDIPSNLRMT